MEYPVLTPEIVSKALNIYHKWYNTNVEDDWYTIEEGWDLNIYLSGNEVLCATIYPYIPGQGVDSFNPYPLIVDPSEKEVI